MKQTEGSSISFGSATERESTGTDLLSSHILIDKCSKVIYRSYQGIFCLDPINNWFGDDKEVLDAETQPSSQKAVCLRLKIES